ncbi:cryptochrome/photolyase family protein [Luteolibacter luteus]|uniref:Deoxyribodipyrimidine photo-lyase n=1 Tax=Luteolibacter luteus TaxID=2728835 RepID=A0A858REP9_9BACT|nr:deoxyribodipyrimidine photo-lyase [Luteolibacter luteus]QJE95044.1 deoxyribodipyrimidine photo-lyase [Luteolibacter luteus]
MPSLFRLAIHWFRRDLRILDNTALHFASIQAGSVLPLYILSDWKKEHHWTGPKRQSFLCGNLASLAGNLETVGGKLVIRCGAADAELEKLVKESGADAIFFNRDPDPFGRAMEAKVETMARKLGIHCEGFHDITLHPAGEVLTQDARPYRVFTPYSRNWLTLEKPAPLPKPRDLASPKEIPSLPLPDHSHWKLPDPQAQIIEAGERAALERLKKATSGIIQDYKLKRDLPGEPGTSRLSQDLRFGLLSPRTIYARAAKAQAETRSSKAKEGIDTFIKELAWREFYMAILWHFPNVLEEEFNPEWRGLWWAEPDELFEAWKEGRTGFPIVDAGMRELLATGHMHNRVRMITAMFLTKDLHIDWRLGEQFFLQHLVDGEIASNNGGWQWSAGTGADAAPYFRIQNPWSQAKRYDPDGRYTKKWVPELRDVPAEKLYEAPKDARPLNKAYPLPCVDHREERDRTLAIFKKHKERTR